MTEQIQLFVEKGNYGSKSTLDKLKRVFNVFRKKLSLSALSEISLPFYECLPHRLLRIGKDCLCDARVFFFFSTKDYFLLKFSKNGYTYLPVQA